jgi:hypothetical protein
MRGIDPAISFLVIILIGLVAGLIFERALRPGWFSRDVANERRAMVTMALIGIAGAFLGFHLTILDRRHDRRGARALVLAAAPLTSPRWQRKKPATGCVAGSFCSLERAVRTAGWRRESSCRRANA